MFNWLLKGNFLVTFPLKHSFTRFATSTSMFSVGCDLCINQSMKYYLYLKATNFFFWQSPESQSKFSNRYCLYKKNIQKCYETCLQRNSFDRLHVLGLVKEYCDKDCIHIGKWSSFWPVAIWITFPSHPIMKWFCSCHQKEENPYPISQTPPLSTFPFPRWTPFDPGILCFLFFCKQWVAAVCFNKNETMLM